MKDMNRAIEIVADMQAAFGQQNRDEALQEVTRELVSEIILKNNLISEEVKETRAAFDKLILGTDIQNQLKEFVDGLCDSMVVVLGAVNTFGIAHDIQDPFTEVLDAIEGAQPPWANNAYHVYNVVDQKIFEELRHNMDANRRILEVFVNRTEDAELDVCANLAFATREHYILQSYYANIYTFACVLWALFDMFEEQYPDLHLTENFFGVMGANMNKFAKDELHAQETVKTMGSMNAYYEAVPNSTLWRIRRVSDGKMLKANGWKPYEIKLG